MTTVNVGNPAVVGNDDLSLIGYTVILTANPASAAVTLTHFYIWSQSTLVGVKVATFNGSAHAYTCKSVTGTLADITSGSAQDITISLPIAQGDFLGMIVGTSGAYRVTTGTELYYRDNSVDHCVVNNYFATYDDNTNLFSFGASGETGGGSVVKVGDAEAIGLADAKVRRGKSVRKMTVDNKHYFT